MANNYSIPTNLTFLSVRLHQISKLLNGIRVIRYSESVTILPSLPLTINHLQCIINALKVLFVNDALIVSDASVKCLLHDFEQKLDNFTIAFNLLAFLPRENCLICKSEILEHLRYLKRNLLSI